MRITPVLLVLATMVVWFVTEIMNDAITVKKFFYIVVSVVLLGVFDILTRLKIEEQNKLWSIQIVGILILCVLIFVLKFI